MTMIERIKLILASPTFADDEDKTHEARMLNAVLWMALGFSFLALIARIFIQDFLQLAAILINLVQLTLWVTLITLLRRGKVNLTGTLFILGIFITINLQAYISGGLHRPIIYANLIALGLATLFSNRRVVWFAVFSVGAATLMYFLDGVFLPAPETQLALSSTLITFSLITLFTALILQFAANNLRDALKRSRADEEELIVRNKELQEYQRSLEAQVETRTNELTKRTAELESANASNQRRANQFEALVQVAQSITSIRDLQELLPYIATVISKHFGFYHVGVFLLDEVDEYAVLVATNSDGGRKMLERKHRLKVGEQGIVGNVTATGEARIALDVGVDAVFFNNPDLPDTHSEMALPLRSGDRIVGALDVQSTETGAFTSDDIQTLGLLADQVSLAIENARLFDESRRALAESQIISRQATREAWKRLPEQQKLLGYRYNITGAIPLKEPVQISETDAVRDNGKQTGSGSYIVPIELRGEVIGTLVVQSPDGNEWNEDQHDLIKAVAERVALAAENARLFEETTLRAERERLVSDITSKIRSHNDPQTMIETAISELRNVLGATRVEVIPQAVRSSINKDNKV